MIQKTLQTTFEFCSRCLNLEINSWINERWRDVNEEAKKQIMQELKAIKLKQGQCLVCKNSLVSDNSAINILKILEETKISEKIREEFRKYFVCS